MVKGKPWTSEEEKKLRGLFEEKKPMGALMKTFGKSRSSIYSKLYSLGLKEQHTSRNNACCSSCLEIPKDLPTVEEALQTLLEGNFVPYTASHWCSETVAHAIYEHEKVSNSSVSNL